LFAPLAAMLPYQHLPRAIQLVLHSTQKKIAERALTARVMQNGSIQSGAFQQHMIMYEVLTSSAVNSG